MKITHMYFVWCITIALLFKNTLQHCEKDQFMEITDTNEVQCIPCPDHCHSCYKDLNNDMRCQFCDEGFFLTSFKKVCKSCAPNCYQCTGDNLD